MHLTFNPKDSNTFASAGLDGVIKVWNLGSNVPNFTLEGHEKGVNYVDYYHGGDKPYLISCADDKYGKKLYFILITTCYCYCHYGSIYVYYA